MNLSLVARNLGQFIFILSILMAVCSLLSLIWVFRGEQDEMWTFQALIACALGGALVSLSMIFFTRKAPRYMHRREAVLLVSFAWILGAFYASLPYWLWVPLRVRPERCDPECVALNGWFRSPARLRRRAPPRPNRASGARCSVRGP